MRDPPPDWSELETTRAAGWKAARRRNSPLTGYPAPGDRAGTTGSSRAAFDVSRPHYQEVTNMLTRAICLFVAIVAWPAGLVAQHEPFLGTWELNLSKSSITRGTPPRAETVVNVLEPGGFRSTLTVVSDRGTNVEIHHYNFDGNFHMTEGSDPRELSFARIDPLTIDQETKRNGAVTVKRRIAASKDGRTMTFIASGASGSGQKYTNDTRVYERK
jgi:hypothetical protein